MQFVRFLAYFERKSVEIFFLEISNPSMGIISHYGRLFWNLLSETLCWSTSGEMNILAGKPPSETSTNYRNVTPAYVDTFYTPPGNTRRIYSHSPRWMISQWYNTPVHNTSNYNRPIHNYPCHTVDPSCRDFPSWDSDCRSLENVLNTPNLYVSVVSCLYW